jgi:surface carbohydrate biosynthesis protein
LSLSLPKQAAVVQFHEDGHDLLIRFIEPEHIVFVDSTRLNFWILIRCMFLRRFSLIGYTQTVIEIVQPQVVITFIDNDPSFYTLKSKIAGPSYIAVQNGMKHNYSYAHKNGLIDQFLEAGSKDVLSADLICTFGNSYSRFFEKYVDSETLVTGNLRNNDLVMTNPNTSEFDIVFMSQHAPFDVSTSSEVVYLNDSSISIQDFYKIESDVAKFLAQYCQHRSLRFAVSGKRGPKDCFESVFYAKAIGGLPYTFLPRLNQTSSYENAYRAKLVVVVDSTIGYELLSRGRKVAFFSARKINTSLDKVQNRDTCFGYPSEYPDSGPFWTNQPDTNEYTRILDELLACPDPDWSLLYKQYTDDLMALSPGSPEFVGALKMLGVASTSEVNDRA